ncbi:MAG TPA: DUF882 domain-containing protein [Kofleriaceae bacterium]|nr:DUF882 domain-containing protein [Kofleriaceae bacterium]
MLSVIVELKIATTAMAGFIAASSPVPLPAQTIAVMLQTHVASPVELELVDGNRYPRFSQKLVLERDGSSDAATAATIAEMFQCLHTHKKHEIEKRTLSILVEVYEKWGTPIEYVSAYRATRNESDTSPHRGARAVDFRLEDIDMRMVRDYLWRDYKRVGVGWYPYDKFIHIDHRTDLNDASWTWDGRKNHYNPPWAQLARTPVADDSAQARRGKM